MNTQTKVSLSVAAVCALPFLFIVAAVFITMTGWELFLVLLALVVIIPLVGLAVEMRNSLARGRGRCHEAWLQVDTELERRHELIAKLVSDVDGHLSHEGNALERVKSTLNAAVASKGKPASRARDENALAGALRHLLAVVDGHPELKADARLLKLQEEWGNAENRVQSAVRIYNGSVQDYNIAVRVGPSALVARTFGFEEREFFHAEPAAEQRIPPVKKHDLQEDLPQPSVWDSSAIPFGIEVAQTKVERPTDASAHAVEETIAAQLTRNTPGYRKVTRRTSPPAWPGWPSGLAGPNAPSS